MVRSTEIGFSAKDCSKIGIPNRMPMIKVTSNMIRAQLRPFPIIYIKNHINVKENKVIIPTNNSKSLRSIRDKLDGSIINLRTLMLSVTYSSFTAIETLSGRLLCAWFCSMFMVDCDVVFYV